MQGNEIGQKFPFLAASLLPAGFRKPVRSIRNRDTGFGTAVATIWASVSSLGGRSL